MFAARRKHKQGFGFGMHRLFQQNFSEHFTQGCPAWLPRHHHIGVMTLNRRGDPGQVSAFARAVQAFKRDEFTLDLMLC